MADADEWHTLGDEDRCAYCRDPWPCAARVAADRGRPKPAPHELWRQAQSHETPQTEYIRLMREHGHLIPGKPEPGKNIFGHPARAPREGPR